MKTKGGENRFPLFLSYSLFFRLMNDCEEIWFQIREHLIITSFLFPSTIIITPANMWVEGKSERAKREKERGRERKDPGSGPVYFLNRMKNRERERKRIGE